MNIQDSNTIKPNQPVNRSYIPSEDERPRQPVRSQKNFQKIMDKEETFDDQEELAGVESEEANQPVSLFDLAKPKKKTELKNTKPLTQRPDNLDSDNLDNVETAAEYAGGSSNLEEFNNLVRKKRFEIPTTPPSASEDDMLAAEENSAFLQPRPVKKETRLADQEEYGQEGSFESEDMHLHKKVLPPVDPKADNAYGSLNSQSIALNQTNDVVRKETDPHSFTMRQIIDKLVESIKVVQKEGVTETVISLRHPPLLEGATLTLMANDQAKKEFSIGFSSLTEAAKAFLDRRLEKDSLTASLEQQGFVVNALVTTTAKEITLNSSQTDQRREREPGDQSNQPREQRQKKQQDTNG